MSSSPGNDAAVEIPPSDVTILPVSGRFSCSFLCLHCGYDLYGLSLDAVCPECGTPARKGLPSDAELYIGALSAGAARRHVRFGFTLVSAFTLVGQAVIVGAIYWATSFEFSVGLGAFIATFMAWSLWRAWVSLDRDARLSRVILADNSIVNRSARGKDTVIRREEVSRIDEDAAGLTIRSKIQQRRFSIPRGLESYDAIRAHLADWSPIVTSSLFVQMTRVALLTILLGGAGLTLQIVQDPWSVRSTALALLIGLAWAFHATFYSMELTAFSRWFRLVALGCIAAWAITKLSGTFA